MLGPPGGRRPHRLVCDCRCDRVSLVHVVLAVIYKQRPLPVRQQPPVLHRPGGKVGYGNQVQLGQREGDLRQTDRGDDDNNRVSGVRQYSFRDRQYMGFEGTVTATGRQRE